MQNQTCKFSNAPVWRTLQGMPLPGTGLTCHCGAYVQVTAERTIPEHPVHVREIRTPGFKYFGSED